MSRHLHDAVALNQFLNTLLDDDPAKHLAENLLELRVYHDRVGGATGATTVALTLEGLDIYVMRSPDGKRLRVAVGTDELPSGVSAALEAVDGLSWERELP